MTKQRTSTAVCTTAVGALVVFVGALGVARHLSLQGAGGPHALGAPASEASRRQAEALRSIGDELSASQARTGLPATAPAAPAAAEAVPAAVEAPQPGEQEASERLSSGMAKLARDLEYNANRGLPEPPQQAVVAAPAPWRPEQGVDDRQGPAIDGFSPSGAPASGGAQVIIRGRNLRPAQVMFGSAPARVVRVTGEAVVVVAPRGAPGPVTVAVTNDDGTFALSREPFTYGR